MIVDPESIVQALDASVEACWPKKQADGDGPDVELLFGSGDFSQEASTILAGTLDSSSSSSSAASSGASSSRSSLSCCSEEGRPSRANAPLSHVSSSTADLSSLSGFCQRESHTCLTADGWKLHIMHVFDPTADAPAATTTSSSSGSSSGAKADATPDAPAASTSGRTDNSTGSGSGSGSSSSSGSSSRRQHPVLMVPGLASSGEHTFDLLPDYSLVNALVARGYDVWVADLRGNGRSQKPSLLDSSTWWTVDDHFLQDVPAVLSYVLAATGAKQVHWVGHSMGGMLAVGLQSQQGPLAGALRSLTLLASGCFGSGSWHSLLKPLIGPITCCGFPAGAVCWAVSLLSGTAAALLPVEALFYVPCNMPRACARALMANCFRFIPSGVIRQFMGSLNTPAGLSAADGSFQYADPARLAGVDVPVLALNGTWDLFCPPAGARRTVELFGSAHKRFVCVGPTYGTGKRHYGHFDLVCGKRAASEVYPHVFEWLEQHDSTLLQQ